MRRSSIFFCDHDGSRLGDGLHDAGPPVRLRPYDEASPTSTGVCAGTSTDLGAEVSLSRMTTRKCTDAEIDCRSVRMCSVVSMPSTTADEAIKKKPRIYRFHVTVVADNRATTTSARIRTGRARSTRPTSTSQWTSPRPRAQSIYHPGN